MKLSKIKEATFDYDDAKFTIKVLLSGARADISDKTVKVNIEIDDVDGEFVQTRSITPSPEYSKALTLQKSLTGWENVKDEEGKDLKCDAAGKRRFCENLPVDVFNDFYETFNEEYNKLAGISKKQSEKAVKNS